jgi:LPXTG-site transpeptidase (sortase) family protein
MIKYSTRNINTVSTILSLIIVLSLTFIPTNFQKFEIKENQIQAQNSIENEAPNENTYIKNELKESMQELETASKLENKQEWQIEIPIINLKAPIAEGTTKEVMDKFVGHFEETSKEGGNIGLAAHNRGYQVNYFQDLKKLNKGDEIIYKYNGKQKKYEVETQKIIKDTDWKMLEKTKDNRITLITCVENQPEYRRCIQAIEREE